MLAIKRRTAWIIGINCGRKKDSGDLDRFYVGILMILEK